MLVVGPVRDDKEHAGGRKTLDDAVEQRLGLGVDPVEILDDQQKRLGLTLPQEQALDRVEGALAALCGVKESPLRIVDRRAQERHKGGEIRSEQLVLAKDLPRNTLADSGRPLGIVDQEVTLDEIDDRQRRCRDPVRNRATAEDAPSPDVVGARQFVDEARLAHPGLSNHRHHVSLAALDFLEALAQGFQLPLTLHEDAQGPSAEAESCAFPSRQAIAAPEITAAARRRHELELLLQERGGGLADHDALGFGQARQCCERRQRRLLVPEIDSKGPVDPGDHRWPDVHRDVDTGSVRVGGSRPLRCVLDRHRGQGRADGRVLDRVQTERRHDRRRAHLLDLPAEALDLLGAGGQSPADEERRVGC